VLIINPNADLDDLINEPRETLDVEVKEWLDLTDNDHRSMVAKEIIALANHGGGFLVIGFEERADGTFEPSAGRPTNLDAWSQDSIQSIVFKYADPGVQCRVHHRANAASRERYPIIRYTRRTPCPHPRQGGARLTAKSSLPIASIFVVLALRAKSQRPLRNGIGFSSDVCKTDEQSCSKRCARL
jgi:hypothetical protein